MTRMIDLSGRTTKELHALIEAHRSEYIDTCREYLSATCDEAEEALADFEREVWTEDA